MPYTCNYKTMHEICRNCGSNRPCPAMIVIATRIEAAVNPTDEKRHVTLITGFHPTKVEAVVSK